MYIVSHLLNFHILQLPALSSISLPVSLSLSFSLSLSLSRRPQVPDYPSRAKDKTTANESVGVSRVSSVSFSLSSPSHFRPPLPLLPPSLPSPSRYSPPSTEIVLIYVLIILLYVSSHYYILVLA